MPVAHDAGEMQYRLHSALPVVRGRLALWLARPFQVERSLRMRAVDSDTASVAGTVVAFETEVKRRGEQQLRRRQRHRRPRHQR
jgi:hypothetical protein